MQISMYSLGLTQAQLGLNAASRRWLWYILSAVFVIALSSVLLYLGPSYMWAPTDIFALLDGAWRIVSGQVPHSDFHTPLGPLAYFLIAMGMKIGDLSLAGYVYGNLIFLLICTGWAGLVCFRRLPAPYAFLLVAFLGILTASPRPLGYTADTTSYAMIYNRYGWILLSIFLVQILVPEYKATPRSRFFDAISEGVLLGLLFYCKITYFGAACGMLAVTLFLREDVRKSVFLIAAGFALLCIAAWAFLGVIPADYLRDVFSAGGAQSPGARLSALRKSLQANYLQFAISVVLWLVIVVVPGSRNREFGKPALRATFIFFLLLAAAIGLTMFNAPEHSDVPLFLTASVILVSLSPNLEVGKEHFASSVDRSFLLVPLIILVFFSNIAVKDLDGLRHAALLRHYRISRGPFSQHFDSDRLRNFVIPDNDERPTGYWLGKEVPANVNDGIALVRRHTTADSRVVVLGFTNYFSFPMGLKPARGDMLWWDLYFSFSRKRHPKPEDLLADADIVVMPLFRQGDKGGGWDIVDILKELYGPYVNDHYALVDTSQHWLLYKRRPQ